MLWLHSLGCIPLAFVAGGTAATEWMSSPRLRCFALSITRNEALPNTLSITQSRASSLVKSSPQELAATLWAA